jgi:hypothetical protein
MYAAIRNVCVSVTRSLPRKTPPFPGLHLCVHACHVADVRRGVTRERIGVHREMERGEALVDTGGEVGREIGR